jgi:hypothetical protein
VSEHVPPQTQKESSVAVLVNNFNSHPAANILNLKNPFFKVSLVNLTLLFCQTLSSSYQNTLFNVLIRSLPNFLEIHALPDKFTPSYG